MKIRSKWKEGKNERRMSETGDKKYRKGKKK